MKMKFIVKKIPILLIFAFNVSYTSGSTLKKEFLDYGDECDQSAKSSDHGSLCNSRLNLACRGNICRCNTESSYDKAHGGCVKPLGSICIPPQGLDKDMCVVNATCQSMKDRHMKLAPAYLLKIYFSLSSLPFDMELYKCQCRRGFEPSGLSNSNCRPLLEYGVSCAKNPNGNDLRCDYGGGQVCGSSNTCACKNEQTMRYNKITKRCETPLGKNCIYDGNANQCSENAICSTFLEIVQRAYQKRVSNDVDQVYSYAARDANAKIIQKEGSCVCSPGYTENSDGNCGASYHVGCFKTSECNTQRFLTCIDGICQCEKGTAQIFNGTTCNIRPGYACTEKLGPQCVQNSTCVKGQCTCATGFTATYDGRCLPGYGAKCSIPENSNTMTCNHFQGLACTGSKCDCFDPSLKWNAKTLMCTAKEGKLCGKSYIVVNSDLAKDIFYPFAISNSSTLAYSIGCEDGFRCNKDELDDKMHRCRKV